MIAWIIGFSIIGSIVATALGGLVLLFPKAMRKVLVPNLVSYATGTLLGAAFRNFVAGAVTAGSGGVRPFAGIRDSEGRRTRLLGGTQRPRDRRKRRGRPRCAGKPPETCGNRITGEQCISVRGIPLPGSRPIPENNSMSARPRVHTVLALVASTLALAPALASAQAWTKQGEETLSVRLGALTSQFDTNARINGSGQDGSNVDLEGDLGLGGNKTTFELGSTLRFAPKHRIDFLYNENKRSGSTTTERDYSIGNELIPAGTKLSSSENLKIGFLGYRYSFFKTADTEIAAGLGFYGANIKFKFDANQPVISIDASTTLPLPVLSVSGDFYLTDRMKLTASANGLKVKFGDVDGRTYDMSFAGEYLLTNNFGIGAAIERFNIRADVTKSDYNGRAEITSNSGRVYLTARF
jgi:hypothetical protein